MRTVATEAAEGRSSGHSRRSGVYAWMAGAPGADVGLRGPKGRALSSAPSPVDQSRSWRAFGWLPPPGCAACRILPGSDGSHGPCSPHRSRSKAPSCPPPAGNVELRIAQRPLDRQPVDRRCSTPPGDGENLALPVATSDCSQLAPSTNVLVAADRNSAPRRSAMGCSTYTAGGREREPEAWPL